MEKHWFGQIKLLSQTLKIYLKRLYYFIVFSPIFVSWHDTALYHITRTLVIYNIWKISLIIPLLSF